MERMQSDSGSMFSFPSRSLALSEPRISPRAVQMVFDRCHRKQDEWSREEPPRPLASLQAFAQSLGVAFGGGPNRWSNNSRCNGTVGRASQRRKRHRSPRCAHLWVGSLSLPTVSQDRRAKPETASAFIASIDQPMVSVTRTPSFQNPRDTFRDSIKHRAEYASGSPTLIERAKVIASRIRGYD